MAEKKGRRAPGTLGTVEAGRVARFHACDVDHARAWMGKVNGYAAAFRPIDATAGFAMDMQGMSLGPVNANTLKFGSRCVVESGGLGVAYHINFTTMGRAIHMNQGVRSACTASSGNAPVFEPTGAVAVDLDGKSEVLGVGFGPEAVENALAEYLDHDVRPLHFPGGGFDPTEGKGRTLADLARVLEREVRGPTGVLDHPIVTTNLADALITMMLHATPHQYHEELCHPAPRICPRPVKRAVDAMQADPARPFTVRELAVIAGVGPRSLQAGFKQHLETTPMAYLRRLRLECAHRDLTRPGPAVTVTEVAYRWGFTHLGRFAAAYQARYGTLPSRAHWG